MKVLSPDNATAVTTATASGTLWDEWQSQREHLIRGYRDTGLYTKVRLRVLDYLIDRYRESREAQRSVTVAPSTDLHANDRVMVVLHHIWKEKAGEIRTWGEAEARISAILKRHPAARAKCGNCWMISWRAPSRRGWRCGARVAGTSQSAGAPGRFGDSGRIAALKDVSLLSDLLALPPASDEHPDERTAIVGSMWRIAQTAR